MLPEPPVVCLAFIGVAVACISSLERITFRCPLQSDVVLETGLLSPPLAASKVLGPESGSAFEVEVYSYDTNALAPGRDVVSASLMI